MLSNTIPDGILYCFCLCFSCTLPRDIILLTQCCALLPDSILLPLRNLCWRGFVAFSLILCVCCVCFLPIHSGHQWTYQPGSHRRKVTQDFSTTFFLRCVPLFFSREGFSHSSPSSTVKSNLVYSTRWAFLFLFFSCCFLARKIPFAGVELTSHRGRGLRGTSELPGRPAVHNVDLLLLNTIADGVGTTLPLCWPFLCSSP